jgi:hypothetical protein
MRQLERLAALQSGGLGDAIPQKYPFFFFFRGEAAKKEEKNQVWDCPPQSHETVTLTPMGDTPPI